MKLLEIVNRYSLTDVASPNTSISVFPDNSDGSLLFHWEDDETQEVFDVDAPVTINPEGSFTVTARHGGEYTFEAHVVKKVHLSDGPRDINLYDARIDTTEPNRLWLKVGKFDVLLNHTDEGIVVDVWPWVEVDAPIYPDEPLATCYAFDTDADDTISE